MNTTTTTVSVEEPVTHCEACEACGRELYTNFKGVVAHLHSGNVACDPAKGERHISVAGVAVGVFLGNLMTALIAGLLYMGLR